MSDLTSRLFEAIERQPRLCGGCRGDGLHAHHRRSVRLHPAQRGQKCGEAVSYGEDGTVALRYRN